jgi:predicted amidohydrolase
MAGTIIERDGQNLYNTAVFLNPKGEVIAKYRKIHLVTRKGSEEAAYLKPGKEVVAVETELAVFGFGICYDLRFPELYRKLAVQKGVEIFLVPAAWPLVRVENWMDLNHVRANENLAYLISCNCAGVNRGQQYLGHSTVVDPHGVPVASAGLFEYIVKAEIDVEELRMIRHTVGHLENVALQV